MTYEPEYTERGIAAFRVFVYMPAEGQSPLRSLFNPHRWTAGRQTSLVTPAWDNSAGFYAHKTFEAALLYSGGVAGRVFALAKLTGRAVEAEDGMRTKYCEIVAFLDLEQETGMDFPRDHLRSYFPEIPIIKLDEVPAIVEALELRFWPKRKPYPLVQWLPPHEDAELIWAPENVGPPSSVPNATDYEMLEPAASYPRETHPLDLRLRKETFRTLSGAVYAYWYLGGTDRSFLTVKSLLQLIQGKDADLITLHRITERG
jgi:hypothetical protein